MLLSVDEFARIRPELQWGLKEVAGRMYNTPQTQLDTQLFWLDFLRNVFAPRFAKQWGVVQLPNFDIDQPVFISDSLNLLLPTQLEMAVYYADNKDSPAVRFRANISQTSVLSIAVLILALCAAIGLFVSGDGAFAKIVLARVV